MFDDLIGRPFKNGGRGPIEYDCWGLAKKVYLMYEQTLPEYPLSAMDAVKIGQQMKQEETMWQKLEKPCVPCLVVIRLSDKSWANHVGVYIGNGQFIHAYKTTGVVIEKIKSWRSLIVGFYVQKGENMCSKL